MDNKLTLWMQPPGGGEPEHKQVADTQELGRLLFQGWTQCLAPTEPTAPAAQPEDIHHEEEK